MKASILSEQEVKKVASLAKLKLTPDEVKKYQKELSEILAYMEKLKKVDTSKVEPTSQVTGLKNVNREDIGESDRTLSVDEALAGTKQKHNNLFLIKSIF